MDGLAMRSARLIALVIFVVACGSADATDLDVEPAVFTEAGDACVDFYRSVQESVEEEPVYMRAFSDRITALGLEDAAAVLSDLASQWEVGTWGADEDESVQVVQWAEAGRLLGEAGAIRCADLAEWWGIDGYGGESDPEEMLRRQASIWLANSLDDYYLLVAGGEAGERFTQIQVDVDSGRPASVVELEVTTMRVEELPKTVDEVYAMLLDERGSVVTYDLVRAVPRVIELTTGEVLQVKVDTAKFPDPIEYFTEISG